ncbi:MAG: site-specific integrase [Gemmatimonadaceae bacterium]|nr:site-specific integrase [Gemmatimonadaceae bacterium]
MTRPKKRASPYFAGEKGRNRVRLFAHWKTGKLYLEWRDAAGRRMRAALGHSDWTVGKVDADARANDVARGVVISRISIETLFDKYEKEVTPYKAESTQDHDRRAMKLFRKAWDATRPADSLNKSDWDSFIRARRTGKIRPDGRKKAGPVRDRPVEQDLRLLLAILNWATKVGHDGGLLLERNPLHGLPVPKEKNPTRDLLRDTEFQQLRQKAAEADPMFEPFLIVVHETGHRGASVRHLRWSDVDLEAKTIRWRAEVDKIEHKHETPMSDAAADALKQWRRTCGRIGEGYIFPSPTQRKSPVSRELVRDWLERTEKLAGQTHPLGRGFHSLRRKFATERRHYPLTDLQHLGGWKDFQTILKCYQRPEMEELRAAMEVPLKRVV